MSLFDTLQPKIDHLFFSVQSRFLNFDSAQAWWRFKK